MSITIDKTEIVNIVEKYGDTLNSIKIDDEIIQNIEEKELLQKVQRLSRLDIGIDLMYGLLNHQEEKKVQSLCSAYAITAISQNKFCNICIRYGTNFDIAKKIYKKATTVKNYLTHLYANHINADKKYLPKMLITKSNLLENSLPNYEELFGNLNYLDVNFDQSIFSPSAYLVDMLRIVDNYIQVNQEGVSLDKRRSDIKKLNLTIENTEVTLPFLKYINENILLKHIDENKETNELLEDISKKTFPLSLPFNYHLNLSYDYAKALNTSLADIYYCVLKEKNISWALSFLNMNNTQKELIIKKPKGDAKKEYLNSLYEIKDYKKLQSTKVFLQKTELTLNELIELFTQGEENENNFKHFYINDSDSYFKLSEDNLNILLTVQKEDASVYLDAFIRLNIFIRLSRYLKLSFQDLDALLRAINMENSIIEEKHFIEIAKVIEIQNYLNISVQEVCALIAPINTIGSKNLYSKFFGKIEQNNLTISTISASLKISQRILQTLNSDLDNINIETLSYIYRLTLFIKKFNVDFKYFELLDKIANNRTMPKLFSCDEIANIIKLLTWLEGKDISIYELAICISPDNLFIDDIKLEEEAKQLFNKISLTKDDDLKKDHMSTFFGINQRDFEVVLILLKSKGSINLDTLDDLKNIYRYIIMVHKLGIDTRLAQSIVSNSDNQVYGKLDINNLNLQNIQEIYLLKDLEVENKEQFIYNLENNNFDKIFSQMNWNETSFSKLDNKELDLSLFIYFYNLFSLSKSLGCRTELLSKITNYLQDGDYTKQILLYNELKNLLIAKNSENINKSIQDIENNTNEFLRDTLLSIFKIKINLKDNQEISEYLLTDTMQSSCSSISPVKEATLAVQTYLNRCKMGLEKDTISNVPEIWWEWLLSYRVWEANRKVFLYPENYLEPSLRPNKTPLFKEFEQNIMQQQISTETLQKLYFNYIQSFSTLAHLVHLGTSIAKTRTPKQLDAVDTLFLFGRTNITPYNYYYQICYNPYSKNPNWQAWQKIEANINSDEITYTYAFNKLFIFWVEIQEKTYRDTDTQEEKQTLFSIYYIFQQIDGTWSTPQTIIDKKEYENSIIQKVNVLKVINEEDGKKEIILSFKGEDFIINDSYEVTQTTLHKEIELYYPKVITLDEKRNQLCSITVQNYVLFAGGSKSDKIDIFKLEDNNLIEEKNLSKKLKLSIGKDKFAGTVVGNYAVFAGGADEKKLYSDSVDVFKVENGSLIKAENLSKNLKLSIPRHRLTACTVGNYAIFAGGFNGQHQDTMDIFKLENNTLIKVDLNLFLKKARHSISSCVVGNYAIFAGGFDQVARKDIDVFYINENNTLEKYESNFELFEERYHLAATSSNTYALFAGGYKKGGEYNNSTVSDKVDVFYIENGVLQKEEKEQENLNLQIARTLLSATSVGEYLFFAGGYNSSSSIADIDVYKVSYDEVKKLENMKLEKARYGLSASSIGDYAIFAGGFHLEGKEQNSIDIIKSLGNEIFYNINKVGRLDICETINYRTATTLGDYAIFTGEKIKSDFLTDTISVFKVDNRGNLIKDETTSQLKISRKSLSLCATTLKNFAIFGIKKDKANYYIDVFTLDDRGNLIKDETASKLKLTDKPKEAATTIANYALFSLTSGDIDVFTINSNGKLVKDEIIKLGNINIDRTAITLGNYAIFVGDTKNMIVFTVNSNGKLIKDEMASQLKLSDDLNKYSTILGNYAIITGNCIDVLTIDSKGKLIKDEEFSNLKLLKNMPSHMITTVGNFVICEIESSVIVLFTLNENGKLEKVYNQILNFDPPLRYSAVTTLKNYAIFSGLSDEYNNGSFSFVNVFKFDALRPIISLEDKKILVTNDFGEKVLFDKIENKQFSLNNMSNSNKNASFATKNNTFLMYDQNNYLLEDGLYRNQDSLTRNIINYNNKEQNQKYYTKRLSTQVLKILETKLIQGGFEELINLDSQELDEFDIEILQPTKNIDAKDISSQIDFHGAYGAYFQEIFFHMPLYIAQNLQKEGNYSESQKWYNFIFNPSKANEYWRYNEFREVNNQDLENILQNEAVITTYNNDPFDPYAIAALRPIAFQKDVFMKYINNLLMWGDAFYIQDTWESLSEACLLYFTARDLLGSRPKSVGTWKTPEAKNYNELTITSQFFVELENSINTVNLPISIYTAIENPNIYFETIANKNLMQYWDKVEDRLFKLRHCMNIKGVQRSLDLYGSEIDPMSLIEKRFIGSNNLTVRDYTEVAEQPYRFSYIIEKAKGLTSTVMQLGSTLLSVFEKQDAEELSRVRATHELVNLNLITLSKENQISEAKATLESLNNSLENAKSKEIYYQEQIDTGLIIEEELSAVLSYEAQALSLGTQTLRTATSIARSIPNIYGLADGGADYGAIPEATASIIDIEAGVISNISGDISTQGVYKRRNQEWEFQLQTAQTDIEQIQNQVEAQEIRLKIVMQELKSHTESIKQSQEIETILKNKFTNKELYSWMVARISSVYYQTYKLALDTAFQAQKSFQSELDKKDKYITYSYWEDSKKGLLAGEGLMFSLSQLEQAYLAGNTRRFEIEKTISLKTLLGKEDGKDLFIEDCCSFELTKDIFNKDFKNHKTRKIKSISITIPAVVGPYENINATLTQIKNSINDGKGSDYRKNQSIAISKGINDSGVFELNFNDSRYLPFEGTGAISSWELQLNGENKKTLPNNIKEPLSNNISDVIVNLKYTALQN